MSCVLIPVDLINFPFLLIDWVHFMDNVQKFVVCCIVLCLSLWTPFHWSNFLVDYMHNRTPLSWLKYLVDYKNNRIPLSGSNFLVDCANDRLLKYKYNFLVLYFNIKNLYINFEIQYHLLGRYYEY